MFLCSLNWQHQLCKNPRPNPDIKTLFVDHSCGQPNGARAPSPATNSLMGAIPKPGGFPTLGAHVVRLPAYRLFFPELAIIVVESISKTLGCMGACTAAFPSGTWASATFTHRLDVKSSC